MNRSSPSALPASPHVRTSSRNRGSPVPARPPPPADRNASTVWPNNRHAAGFAARTVPSGVVIMRAALHVSKNVRYCNRSRSSRSVRCFLSEISVIKTPTQGWPLVSSVIAWRNSSAGEQVPSFFLILLSKRSGFFVASTCWNRSPSCAGRSRRFVNGSESTSSSV